MTELIAAKLRDADSIAKAKVFPYQLLTAYKATGEVVPLAVREGLQDALEIALVNVPEIAGQVVVCPDVSGLMSSPVTGYRASCPTAAATSWGSGSNTLKAPNSGSKSSMT